MLAGQTLQPKHMAISKWEKKVKGKRRRRIKTKNNKNSESASWENATVGCVWYASLESL